MAKTAAAPCSPRPNGELLGHIRQQVRNLLASADRYDDGVPHVDVEALTMAVRLRTLLHHTGSSAAALVSSGHLDTAASAAAVSAAAAARSQLHAARKCRWRRTTSAA
jgi:hypothetical protein